MHALTPQKAVRAALERESQDCTGPEDSWQKRTLMPTIMSSGIRRVLHAGVTKSAVNCLVKDNLLNGAGTM